MTNQCQIHTISFNCQSAQAIDFLRQLALDNHGRFHLFEREPQDTDTPFYYDFRTGQLRDNSADSIAGTVTSEDIGELQKEIDDAETFLQRAQEYRAAEMTSHSAPPMDDAQRQLQLAWDEAERSKRRQVSQYPSAAGVRPRPAPAHAYTPSKPTKSTVLRNAYTSSMHRPRYVP